MHVRPQTTEATQSNHSTQTEVVVGQGGCHDLTIGSGPCDANQVIELVDAGVRRYRINVSWNKVTSGAPGAIGSEAFDALSDTIDLLLDGGIEPLIALDNSAVPQFLVDDGGWQNLATARAFGDIAGALGARLGDRVYEWVTIANPRLASHDPSMFQALAAAQTDAVQILRAHCPHGLIGSTVDVRQFDHTNEEAQGKADQAWIDHLVESPKPPDFISLNIGAASDHPSAFVAEVIRVLAARNSAWSFVVNESGLATTKPGYQASGSAVQAHLKEIAALRTDGIAVSGAFAAASDRRNSAASPGSAHS